MGKRLDSRRSRGSRGGVRREAMAKQQLELIARDKTERPAKKKTASKAALKVASKAKPKASSKSAPAAALKALPKPPKPIVRLTATDMAARQRESSVSEFFTQ